MRLRCTKASLLLTLVSGCGHNSFGTSLANVGRFDSEFAEVQLLSDGRNAKLLKTFRYSDRNNNTWTAPAGEVVDGATIPKLFWGTIGGPFEGKYRFASIIHDHYCRAHGGKTWQEVHRMFYEACLAGGTDRTLALTMYSAVYHFGPRWGPELKGAEELAYLIPPARARIAIELEAVQSPPNHGFENARLKPPTIITQTQLRTIVLAPRRMPGFESATAQSATVRKWDRIRAYLRDHPDAEPGTVERIE